MTSTDAAVRLLHFLRPVPGGQSNSYDDGYAYIIRERLDDTGPHSPATRLLTRTAQRWRAIFLLGSEGPGTGLVFARDGATLHTASGDGTVRSWNPAVPLPGTRINDASYFQQASRHPAASPDGSRILYAGPGGTVRYWREDGSVLLPGDHMPLAVLPDGRLATMDRATSDILLWREENAVMRLTDRIAGPGYIQGFDELLRGLVFADGTRIAGITPGRVFVVDLKTRTTAATEDQGWDTGPSRAWDIAISPDGRHLLATGLGRRARLYEPANLATPAPPIGDFRTYDTALAFHPDGRRLYCGSEDGRVRVFETATWTELPDRGWQAQSGPVTALAVGNDPRLVATAGDTTLKLWLAEKTTGAASVEILSFPTYMPAAWLQFGRDASGADHSLLHASPDCPLEIWTGRDAAAASFAPPEERADRKAGPQAAAPPGTPLDSRLKRGIPYRIRAFQDQHGKPAYIGYFRDSAVENGETPLRLVTEGQPGAVILEVTRVDLPESPGALVLKAETDPDPTGGDVSGKSPLLQTRDDGRIVVIHRERGGEGRGWFALTPPRFRAPGFSQAVSLKCLWSGRNGHFLRHRSSEIRLSLASDDPDFQTDTTWIFEPR
ncbi:MAG: hypothetical protein R3F19_27935 [Verrucomicrobiales bacterium]